MKPKKILLIDDEELIRISTQVCLEVTANWEVILAASGQEGLLLAELQQPDVILLDISMPEMNGLTTFEYLRNNQAISHIPVILLTAKVQTSEQQQFIDLGITGVIIKPYDPHGIASQIAAALGWNI